MKTRYSIPLDPARPSRYAEMVLPDDLTIADANRLVCFVKALAVDEPEEQ